MKVFVVLCRLDIDCVIVTKVFEKKEDAIAFIKAEQEDIDNFWYNFWIASDVIFVKA